MITASFKLTEAWTDGVRGLISATGRAAKDVVRKETGEVMKTLVRTTPAAKVEAIRSGILAKFNALQNPPRTFNDTGKGDVNWYYFGPNYLIGVARESDMMDASVPELKALLYKTTKTGRVRGQHGKQRVLIWKKITTKAATVKRLAAAKVRNRGRLRAGWLVAWRDGAVMMSGTQPGWITRHLSGARGRFVNELQKPEHPQFTIANFAKGATLNSVNSAVRVAVGIRAKAMQKNALLFMRGKKKVGDYRV